MSLHGAHFLDDDFRHVELVLRSVRPLAVVDLPQVVQRALERVLYIWALRHPASGYVQGINDLATPFFLVFLTPHLPRDRPAKPEDVAAVAPATLAEVERTRILGTDRYDGFGAWAIDVDDSPVAQLLVGVSEDDDGAENADDDGSSGGTSAVQKRQSEMLP